MTTFDYAIADEVNIADGAPITTANMGSVTGLTLATVISTGTVTYVAASQTALHRHVTGAARFDLGLNTATSTLSILYKLTLPTANPAANSRIVEVLDSAGSPVFKGRINHETNGQLKVYNAANTAVFNTTGDISGEIYIAYGLQPGTTITNGKIRFAVYDSTFTLISGTSYTSDAQDVGVSTTLKTVRVGRINTVTDSSDLLTHYVRISDSQITPLAQLSNANAGADQTDIEPWTTVTLTGSGTPSTWTQDLSGGHSTDPVVTLGGSGNVRTFTAPPLLAGVTLQFLYGSDPMTVTVLPATDAIKVGSTLVPIRLTRQT